MAPKVSKLRRNSYLPIQVAWIRQKSRTIISLHGELVTQSRRYVISSKNKGSVNLVLTNVRISDAGTYICQINSNPMINLVRHCFLKTSLD